MSVHLVHGSCVAIGDAGILIVGPSGSGKSDLALRLVDRGAMLVADDYCHVTIDRDGPLATTPAAIAGLIEIRGLGILSCPALPACILRLVVKLGEEPPRMPSENPLIAIAGTTLPVIEVNARAASAPIVVEWALRRAVAGDEGE